ncbi:oligosaccharide flippase family protein [Marinobacter salinexigens]|uniref:Oligosaccharide flippase family protein n=1 Tax=Marinobacter salinexigens TaxID=2919747 RepID=A0A5B0VKR8_9GAMM|nr:oligosaccharide flippase family protein [Marinobacter salinexigens]KAA1174705.1 oligosaccharide flippase family protein [Marinobacter salinexigens]
MLKRLSEHRFFRAVVTLASASAGGQLIMLAAMPLLTRLYAPDAFGVFSVFASVMGVVLVISSLRYELAVPLPGARRSALQLLLIALVINVCISLIATVAVAVFRFEIASLVDTPLLASYLWLLPLAILSGGTFKALNYWAIRSKDYRKIGVTKLTQACSNVTVQILGGVSGLGAFGLILGQILGQSAGITRLAKGLSLNELREGFNKLRSMALFTRYSNFPRYDAPAAAVNVLSAQLPNVAMALLFGPAAAGFYYLADRVLAVPMSIVGQAVGQVLFSQAREDLASGALFKRVLGLLLGLSGLASAICLVVTLIAEPAFVFIFGDGWRDAGVFSSWLILGLSVQFLYSPLSTVLMATNGQLVNLSIHTLLLLLKFSALYAAFILDSQLIAVQLISGAMFLGYGVGIFVIVYRARGYRREGVS